MAPVVVVAGRSLWVAAFAVALLVVAALPAQAGAVERSPTVLPWKGNIPAAVGLSGDLYLLAGWDDQDRGDRIYRYDVGARTGGFLSTRLPDPYGFGPTVWNGEHLVAGAIGHGCPPVSPTCWSFMAIDLVADEGSAAGISVTIPPTYQVHRQMGWARSPDTLRGCVEGCAYLFVRDTGDVYTYNPVRQTSRHVGTFAMPNVSSWVQLGDFGYFFGTEKDIWRFDFVRESLELLPTRLPCNCTLQAVPRGDDAILMGFVDRLPGYPGYRHTITQRVLVLDGATGTLSDPGWLMQPARNGFGAAVFGDELVFAGGNDGPNGILVDEVWHRSLINQPPTLQLWATHATAHVDEWVRFEAAASDADGTVSAVSWTLGDGQAAQGSEVVRTYGAPGTYHITATVTDNEHATVVRNAVLTIEPAAGSAGPTSAPESYTIPPPEPTATQTSSAPPPFDNRPPLAAASCIDAGLELACSAIASLDPDGDTLTFTWDWGDGSTSNGSPVTHSYAALGDYTLRLIASDGHATAEHVVAIRLGADRPPTDNAVSVIGPAAQEHDEEAPAPTPAFLLLVLFVLAVVARRRL